MYIIMCFTKNSSSKSIETDHQKVSRLIIKMYQDILLKSIKTDYQKVSRMVIKKYRDW